ncbi:MAG: hypothetical protein ACR2G3_11155 [Solirubrobacterales bacterium]
MTAAVLALAVGASGAAAKPWLPDRGKRYQGVSDTGEVAGFQDFRRQVKAHPAVLQELFHWDVSLTASGAVDRWERTDTLGMVSLSTKLPANGKPQISVRGIARGNGDRYILRYNEVLGNLNRPTYIRLMPEMNGYWNPYCAYNADGTYRGDWHSTRAFKRAWRRFVIITRGGRRAAINQRLRRLGMPRILRADSNRDRVYDRWDVPKRLDRPKVAFMWVPQTIASPNVPGNQPGDYWPGGRFVDWVGVDIFSKYQSAFDNMQAFFNRYDDYPFMIGEWSPWDGDPGGNFTHRLLKWAEDHRRVRLMAYYRSVSINTAYDIDHYPAARRELRSHLNKRTWDEWAPGQRD